MSLTIAGIGTAVPEHSISQADAARIVAPLCCDTDEQQRWLHLMYRRSGVHSRHSVLLETSDPEHERRQSFFADRNVMPHGPSTGKRMRRYETEALPLAERAVRNALDQSGVKPGQVTHLITVSCTGFIAPGIDISLIEKLSLPRRTQRTHIGFMGCHGALVALRTAEAIARSDPAACVLICAVELCSLHQQYGWRNDQIVANALFADGAAAVVGMPASRGNGPWRVHSTTSILIPDTFDRMGWQVGDYGFEMTLSPDVPEEIKTHLRPLLVEWLGSQGISLDQVRAWAIHPGGPRILQAIAATLDLSAAQMNPSEEILRKFGNMSSPTVLFILQELLRQGASPPAVMLAFGPGLTIEASLLSS